MLRAKVPFAQARMMRYLVKYFMDNMFLPSGREAQDAFGLLSQTAVCSCWHALCKKGLLIRANDRKSRGTFTICWQKAIEYAKYIWPHEELKTIHFIIEDQEFSLRLPYPNMYYLQLIQENREVANLQMVCCIKSSST
jgi:hypothetical protein